MNTKKIAKKNILLISLTCVGVMTLMACGGSTGSRPEQALVDTMSITGIARFEGPQHCTAVALDMGQENAPAYALTSGHCAQNYSDPDSAYQVVRNQAGKGQLVFKYEESTPSQQVHVPVLETVYSTLNQTDLAVLRLEGTVAQLRARGVTPSAKASTPACPAHL